MKGEVSMMLAAMLRARAEGVTPAGDILLAVVSDEEAGGVYGAKFLVEEHPQHFAGIRYALGEFGGANMAIAGKTFYPIQVVEKRNVWLKAILRGPAGHGAFPMRGGAMAKLSHFLRQLDRQRMPPHITPVVRQMFHTIAAALGFPNGFLLRLLLNPAFTGRLLNLLGAKTNLFEPMFYNTVNATIVQGGEKINVIPSQITLELDGRLLPGIPTETFLAELRALVGVEAAYEVVDEGPLAPPEDMGLFAFLAGLLKAADPQGLPIPMLLPAVTDGRFFARLGIQTYGFTPLKLPPDLSLTGMAHAADERVPVDALNFGSEVLYQAIKQYRG
jgi:acetylornithine deacetylase/succinyl-diaminopimelate desuccinylase-like protein